MGIARRIEQRLEALVEGLVGRVFRGPLHPAELAGHLVRQADLASFTTPLGPTTINRFRLAIHPDDLGGAAVPPALLAELAAVVEDTAAERGWRLEGPARVSIEADPTVRRGSVSCSGEVQPGPRPPWAVLRAGSERHPVTVNRALLGRGSDSDVTLNDDRVSRRHALLWREAGVVYLRDLGSSNGSRVNGRRVGGDPLEVAWGSTLDLGGLSLRLEEG